MFSKCFENNHYYLQPNALDLLLVSGKAKDLYQGGLQLILLDFHPCSKTTTRLISKQLAAFIQD